MRAIIACAGSGGHINPGIAIANTIMKNEPGSEIVFVGTKYGMENELVKKAGYNLVNIHAGRLVRKIAWYNIRNMGKAVIGIFDTKRLIKKFKPDVVIGTGGYICVPVMKGAHALNIPYVLHESNAYPGLSVKVVAGGAAKVLLGFEEAKAKLARGVNTVFTGTPAKFNMDHMMALDKEKCKEEMGLREKAKDRKIIFITGGSQGASKFNETVINMIKKYMPQDFYVVIATGTDNYESVNELTKGVIGIDNYLKIEKFVYEMDKMYKSADLLVTRAGALTITELTIARRPAILIPLPTAAENHQYFNAKVMENAGAGIVLEENSLNEKTLYDTIESVIADETKLNQMGDNAAKIYRPNVEQKIYEEIKEVIR